MTKTNKLSIGILLGIAVVIGILLGVSYFKDRTAFAGLSSAARDLVGTRVGTTTTPVLFYTPSATTTYPILIGGDIDTAVISLIATASTTGSLMNLAILGSQDSQCDTATTTTSLPNTIVTGDINWFDVSSNIKDLAGSTSLTGTTTVISVSSTAASYGKEIVLTDLNVRCLALQVNASSTNLYSQIRIKQN